MNKKSPMVQVKSVCKEYSGVENGPSVTVLTDVHLDVGRGETIAIIGPSGSGKSTLLNLIGALDTPTSGSVVIDGDESAGLNELQLAQLRNKKIGFIFQDHHLLPQCSILENVLLPTLAFQSSTSPEAVSYARDLLERVGLSERIHHRPAQLSGGERQRVAYTRALINKPVLLLADEPTGALDHETAQRLMQLLLEINRESGLTSIIVTHARDLVKNMDNIYELNNGTLSCLGEPA